MRSENARLAAELEKVKGEFTKAMELAQSNAQELKAVMREVVLKDDNIKTLQQSQVISHHPPSHVDPILSQS